MISLSALTAIANHSDFYNYNARAAYTIAARPKKRFIICDVEKSQRSFGCDGNPFAMQTNTICQQQPPNLAKVTI